MHGFSPSEFIHFQEVFNEPVEGLLKEFVAAGLGSIPGGGGEILVDRVRKRIAPLKADTGEWMGVMDKAHALGLASSATMMFGHVETLEDRIEHLDVVRRQQDVSLGRLVEAGRLGLGAEAGPIARARAYGWSDRVVARLPGAGWHRRPRRRCRPVRPGRRYPGTGGPSRRGRPVRRLPGVRGAADPRCRTG